MKHSIYPDDYVSSTYDIDFAAVAKQGYEGVIFDVDNTLVPHGAPADDRAVELFQWLHNLGYRVVLLSNNKEPRVKSFCEKVKFATYIYKANKPSPKNYRLAMENMNTTEANTIFVGDQIFTDIWGANRAGIRSVMVKPVEKWHEEIQIVLKRFIEALVLIPYPLYVKNGNGNKVPLIDKNKSQKDGEA